MIVSAIAAMTEEGVIGRANSLPWKIPEDLKYFKEKTLGKAVLMGRKTFDSMGRPLPNRENFVISRTRGLSIAGVHVVSSLERALEDCRRSEKLKDSEVFVIGGAEIYKMAMPLLDRLYLTIIHVKIAGDTYFPDLNSTESSPVGFRLLEASKRQRTQASGAEEFTFFTYERIR